MNVMLATVVNGRQAVININREAGRNKLISYLIYLFITKPFNCGILQTLPRRLPGVVYVPQ